MADAAALSVALNRVVRGLNAWFARLLESFNPRRFTE